jgi:hypothetical protein
MTARGAGTYYEHITMSIVNDKQSTPTLDSLSTCPTSPSMLPRSRTTLARSDRAS